jgi:soluble P-type ATPase
MLRIHNQEALSASLDIHVLTADTRGTAAEQLTGLPAQIHRLEATSEDVQKRDFAPQWDLRGVVAFGNGANDRLMLKAVKEAGAWPSPSIVARAAPSRCVSRH